MATIGTRYNPGFWYWWPFMGFYDFGPAQVPPFTQIQGMTDRTTGQVWYLAFDNNQHLFLTNLIPASFNSRSKVWGPFDGPFIGNWGLRIGVQTITVNGQTAPHIVVDSPAFNVSAAGPFGYGANNNLTVAIVSALGVVNPAALDHLEFTILLTQPPLGPQPVGSPPIYPIVIPGPGPTPTFPDYVP